MKNLREYTIGIIIGVLLSSITVYAASLINSSSVIFDNTKSKVESENVEDVVEELHQSIKDINPFLNFKLTNMESIYYKTIKGGYGENINIDYTIPEGVEYLLVSLDSTFAFTTYYEPAFSGDGFNSLIETIRNTEGSYAPYSRYYLFYMKVNPGKTLNIKTNDINLTRTVGNYTTSVVVAY